MTGGAMGQAGSKEALARLTSAPSRMAAACSRTPFTDSGANSSATCATFPGSRVPVAGNVHQLGRSS